MLIISSFCSVLSSLMDKHMVTTIVFTMTILLPCAGYAAALRRCPNCGRKPVPYPLSTGPDCGDPWYKLRCTEGTLWLDALGGSSYMISSIDPDSRRIVIRPAGLAPNKCVSTDFRSEGIHLNENLPFNITASNTILLFNCTDALLHLQTPINCSANCLCQSYIKDHADTAPCMRGNALCCMFKTGGSYSEYIIRVHRGSCAAYQSFVDFDAMVPPPAKKWPEPGVELEWVLPAEPVCKDAVDCKDLLNSKCSEDPVSVGQRKCFCTTGFKWDPVNGLCQNVNCPKHGKDKHRKSRKQKTVLLAAVAVSLGGTLCVAISIMAIFYKKHNHSKREAQKDLIQQREQMLAAKAAGRSARIFTSREIKKATNNFSQEKLIGSGGFGEVFKGTFDDGTVTAIKRAKLGNTKGIEQLVNEVRILCQVNHRSLVRLLGCCVELDQPLLIYEYVPNGTLFDHLHCHGSGGREPLSWLQRLKIAHQTALGLSYLHSFAVPPIYHRDVKSSNILLDDKFDAKVSDFGLSRLVEITEANKSHIFTSAQGTLGYLDPEYYQNFQLTDKSDVYSFGVVLLEMLTSEKAIDFNREEENVNLAVYAKKIMSEERLMDVVDPLLKDGASKLELETVKSLGYLAIVCLDEQRQNRPSMKEVSDEIEYLISIIADDASKTQMYVIDNTQQNLEDKKPCKIGETIRSRGEKEPD